MKGGSLLLLEGENPWETEPHTYNTEQTMSPLWHLICVPLDLPVGGMTLGHPGT